MAKIAETKPIVAHGGNGGARLAPAPHVDELAKAQDIARRYRCEFIDLHNFQLHHDLFKKIPVDLMFRYNFVPLDETEDGRLAIAHRRSPQSEHDRRDQPAAEQEAS